MLAGYKIFKTRNKVRRSEYGLENHSDNKFKFIRELGVLSVKNGVG